MMGSGCLDLDAPILPGRGAAGIALGSAVAAALGVCAGSFIVRQVINTCLQLPTDTVRYTSDPVVLWARDGTIEQIQVRQGYRGLLPGGIGIGATLAEVEAQCGPLEEDEDGNFVLAHHSGVALQVAAPLRLVGAAGGCDERVIACFVFPRSSSC